MLVQQHFRNVNTTNINSRFRKDQLQQNRDQLQQRTLLGIDFISIGHVLPINTGELLPPAGKAQIREGGKSENIGNEESNLSEIFLMTMKKIIRNIVEEHVLFITTYDLSYTVIGRYK